MLFDRTIEDSLGFIRRMLWARGDSKDTRKPFQATKSIAGEFGFIYLLEGRDTPRAVRTWMYSPKRQHLNSARMVANSVSMDLHIYMDFLGPLPKVITPKVLADRKKVEEQRQQGISINTHRLQILKASHFLNADGFYDCELVFWKDLDCYPPQEITLSKKLTEKAIAIKLTNALAFKCLDLASPLSLKTEEWAEVVDEVIKTVHDRLQPAP
ncbi:MAG: hypothetical protein F6J95_005515 [Leptolyngbya sp. SIO1E4]|nr:hypothetical protein [Leptolyngbya sp. SIO1E4]